MERRKGLVNFLKMLGLILIGNGIQMWFDRGLVREATEVYDRAGERFTEASRVYDLATLKFKEARKFYDSMCHDKLEEDAEDDLVHL